MNEVEKLYSLAGVEKEEYGYCDWDSNCPYPHHKCNNECPFWKIEKVDYPPFTAEKQIHIIKWLARRSHITIGLGLPWGQYDDDWWCVTCKKGGVGTDTYKLEEALANFINSLWQNLTEEERKQIKEMLE